MVVLIILLSILSILGTPLCRPLFPFRYTPLLPRRGGFELVEVMGSAPRLCARFPAVPAAATFHYSFLEPLLARFFVSAAERALVRRASDRLTSPERPEDKSTWNVSAARVIRNCPIRSGQFRIPARGLPDRFSSVAAPYDTSIKFPRSTIESFPN